jgi:hypothetical protein
MELRIALGRGKSVLGKEAWVVEIDRGIGYAARGIDIDDFEIFADRTSCELAGFRVAVPRDAQSDFVDVEGLEA